MKISNVESLARLSDAELLLEVKRLAAGERTATAAVIRSLMELDARRLYLAEGFPSLFAYCTKVLHYSEHAALNRIEVARAAMRVPLLLDHIADGGLHLTGARLLAPHLTVDNLQSLVSSARHKSKREIEEIIAALQPQLSVAPVVRKLPSRTPASAPVLGNDSLPVTSASRRTKTSEAIAARAVLKPLGPERYKLQVTIGDDTRDKLRQVTDLLRHSIPDGDPGAILDRALTVLLKELQRNRYAAVEMPRPAAGTSAHSRHIPAAVKREVWQRDGGRCAFVGSSQRCAERGGLEFHHVVPFAIGGVASAQNIELRCRGHNQYEASLFFGPNGNYLREVSSGWGGSHAGMLPGPGVTHSIDYHCRSFERRSHSGCGSYPRG
jgi:5-methylcytosine-specific restriction endonuclease McrA